MFVSETPFPSYCVSLLISRRFLLMFVVVRETGDNCYNFQLKSLFGQKFDRYIISLNVYIKFIIHVNKIYHTIDIT